MTSGINEIQIAGWKTKADWQLTRQGLVVGTASSHWATAFREYFVTRLDLRYLGPIRLLQLHGSLEGEGFSILAIQCSLVEFLESTLQGTNYRYRLKGDPPVGPHEYSRSKDMFIAFLRDREPFRNEFSESLAAEFYESVRCGLLHEARTKNGWRIWADEVAGKIVDPQRRIIYRNGFQNALDRFIAWYGAEILRSRDLQDAFIRKFDDLC